MKVAPILIAATCATLSACAGMPPSKNEISQVPQIQFGQPLPEDNNYVLYFPAGMPLPVSAVVDGNLFERAESATFHITLKHEVYVYQKFASFNAKSWRPGYKLIRTQLQLRIPQKNGKNAGLLHLQLDKNRHGRA